MSKFNDFRAILNVFTVKGESNIAQISSENFKSDRLLGAHSVAAVMDQGE